MAFLDFFSGVVTFSRTIQIRERLAEKVIWVTPVAKLYRICRFA
jgi:hypothetical protein